MLVLTFLIMQENDLIGMLRKISKFMTSQSEKQAIIMNISSDISKRKEN